MTGNREICYLNLRNLIASNFSEMEKHETASTNISDMASSIGQMNRNG